MFFSFYLYPQNESFKRKHIGRKVNSLKGGQAEMEEDFLGQSSNFSRIFFPSKGEREIADDPLPESSIKVERKGSQEP